MKLLALCVALGLGGGYVWQRQKVAAVAAEKADREEKRAMMSGSKSALIVEEADQVSRDELERMLMSSSKSGAVVLEDVEPEPLLPPVADEEKKAEDRTILPGSKSIGRILPPPDQEEEEEP